MPCRNAEEKMKENCIPPEIPGTFARAKRPKQDHCVLLEVTDVQKKLVRQTLGKGKFRLLNFYYIKLYCNKWEGWMHVPQRVGRTLTKKLEGMKNFRGRPSDRGKETP